MASGIRYTIEEVRNFIESRGFELLSNSYFNNRTRLNVRCSCGNSEWITNFGDIRNGHTCSMCGNKRAGKKSHETRVLKHPLSEVYPDVCKEWDYIKNEDLKPENFSYLDATKIWWICQLCGRSYSSSIHSRTQKNSGCIRCSAKRRGKETSRLRFNKDFSLGLSYPEIAKEWDYEKNNYISPLDIFCATGRKYYWLCSKGHSYLASVSNRTKQNSGCPICKKSKGEISLMKYFEENNIYYIPQYRFPDCKNVISLPFDFAIFYDPDKSDLAFIVEYDGELHYKSYRKAEAGQAKLMATQKNDEIKNRYCEDNNIKLLRIPYWEKDNIVTILEKEIFPEGR